LRHVLKFQPRRAKHHAKHVRRCQSANSGRSMTLLDLSPADFRQFLTVLVDRRLLGSQCCLSTGLVANGIRLTKRCNALSSRSDVTRGLPDLGNSITSFHFRDQVRCTLHRCNFSTLLFFKGDRRGLYNYEVVILYKECNFLVLVLCLQYARLFMLSVISQITTYFRLS
jgi:hypothetical protein